MNFVLFLFFTFIVIIIEFAYVIEDCLYKWTRIAFIALGVLEFTSWITVMVIKTPVSTPSLIHKILVATFLLVSYIIFQVYNFNEKTKIKK